jgi:YVTN family beta-propeller protein
MELSFGMGVLDMNKWARGGLIPLGVLVAFGIIINNLVAPPDDEAAVTATKVEVTTTVEPVTTTTETAPATTTMPSLTDEGQQGSAGATGSQEATVTVGAVPHGVGFDGSSIWVANAVDGTVSKVDVSTNTVTATVTVGDAPFGVGFDGSNIWVANTGDATVSKIVP